MNSIVLATLRPPVQHTPGVNPETPLGSNRFSMCAAAACDPGGGRPALCSARLVLRTTNAAG
eukprot:CAMPEP_0176126442 /NCGR_PEP_ID=MMETSP0120_2-20121206/63819_1 /TAXON_ID=160619 /ORGANISM="Kryptoperidinium foliaceum, Strain CCMP 1326" /LENGTH=61 /DNA_ID=CAMNT_0017461371 /DNA_START=8 /DNA_END=191 /DNA_ORIENTATION=+